MEPKIVQLTSLSGILGALLMFSGDMILYYEPISGQDYNSIARMSVVSVERLIAGGIIGPIASIFYVIGGYLFFIIFRPVNKVLAIILFISFSIMFVFVGTYHAMFPNYGFAGRLPEPQQLLQINFIETYLKAIYILIFIFGSIWTLILFYLVISKKTPYPIWMLIFTPTMLVSLAGIVKNYIPYPLGGIIYGGWINLCYMLFFLICFLYFTKTKSIVTKYNIN